MGSSSSTHGRSASTTRASASRARSPADSAGAVLAERRVQARPAARAPAPPGRPGAAPPTAARRSASGRPSRRLSATVPATNTGRCGSQATGRRQRVAAHRPVPRPGPCPAVGARARPAPRAASTCRSPTGPVDRGDPAAGTTRSTSARAGAVRPGCTHGQADPSSGGPPPAGPAAVRRRVRGAAARSLGRLERRDALGGGVELRADPAQRPVGLRRQQQHHQRGAQVEVAGGEPDADGDRHQRDRQRGDQLQHRRGGEGDPQRVHAWPRGSGR